MDLVQNAIKEGTPKFTDKQKPQEEGNSDSEVDEALYVKTINTMMVDIMDNNNIEVVEVSPLDYTNQVKVVQAERFRSNILPALQRSLRQRGFQRFGENYATKF